jgi:hypothetical protein
MNGTRVRVTNNTVTGGTYHHTPLVEEPSAAR